MWSSWVKRNGTTQVMYIARLNDGPKIAKKTFSIILERVFKMVSWRWRKWNHIKKDIFEVEVFSPLRILTSPLFKETLGAFLFLPLFSFFFSIIFSLFFFYAPSPEEWGGLMIFEEKIHFFKNFLFKWNGMVTTVDILEVDVYSGMGLCMPI
jgi:hypothetical protein